MNNVYTIIVTILRVNGICDFGHKVGDSIMFDGETVNGRICLHAMCVLLPYVLAIHYGADFPWLDTTHKDALTCACPDAQNPVIFEIRRVRKE